MIFPALPWDWPGYWQDSLSDLQGQTWLELQSDLLEPEPEWLRNAGVLNYHEHLRGALDLQLCSTWELPTVISYDIDVIFS